MPADKTIMIIKYTSIQLKLNTVLFKSLSTLLNVLLECFKPLSLSNLAEAIGSHDVDLQV